MSKNKGTFESLIGRIFGKLTVLSRLPNDKFGTAKWLCQCECGHQTNTRTTKLISGKITQCQSCNRKGNIDRRLPPGEYGFNNHYRSIQRGAEKRRIEFSLTKGQVRELNQRPCYYCGCPPSQIYNGTRAKSVTAAGRLHAAYTYNGVDRVDNTKGYTIDNCVPCCKVCNWMKSDLPYEDFITHIEQILAIHKKAVE
jgi:hypothetical protein